MAKNYKSPRELLLKWTVFKGRVQVYDFTFCVEEARVLIKWLEGSIWMLE